tara:strand:- start:485 stop:1477 length:993 start_codon:yes stop_codon:yes gene_type:complete
MKFLKSSFVVLFLAVALTAATFPSIPGGTALSAAEGAVEADSIPGYLQDISVTIRAKFSEGSGVAFTRGGVTYIWTAAHVVDGLRTTRMVVDPKTGTPRTLVEFKDAQVVKTLIEDGRTVGRLEMDAEVIRYSDATHGEDLALLRVRKKGFIEQTAKFHLDKKIPKLGTRLLHVGSLLGQQGSNSMTTGIMSQHGRLIGKTVYDQTTVTAFPGSSGGGVYLEDGSYVGMLVRGAGEGFNLIVPTRRMKDWATRAGILWALDPDVKMPSEEELKKIPVEDVGTKFASGKPGEDGKKSTGPMKFPYHIHDLTPMINRPPAEIEQLPVKLEEE